MIKLKFDAVAKKEKKLKIKLFENTPPPHTSLINTQPADIEFILSLFIYMKCNKFHII